MSRRKEKFYNTQILIDGVPIGWVSEASYSFDYENEQQVTHSGKLTMSSPYPGVEVSFTKLTKCEVVDEQKWLDLVDKAQFEGITITMITKQKNGSVILHAYDCKPDSEEWTNNAGEFMEIEGTFQGEDFDRYFVKNGATGIK